MQTRRFVFSKRPSSATTRREGTELAESSLAAFVQAAWPVLEPGTAYRHNWHIELVCEYLQAVLDGSPRRLLINQPPRNLKSTLVTICWPVWCWIHQPELRFMFTSYSQSLSTFHSVQRRLLIQSDWFQARWGERFQLAPGQNQKTEFSNTRQGMMIATSVGGTSIGKGGDILVFDDPMNPTEALSPTMRASTNAWLRQGFFTRLNDPEAGRIVGVMQRLHEEDTSGMVLAMGGWEHVCLPAEAEGRTVVTFPISGRVLTREAGDLLFPERESAEVLARRKVELGSYGYAGQYQQRPAPEEGGIVKRQWWRFWYPQGVDAPSPVTVRLSDGSVRECPQRPLPAAFDEECQSWDMAFKGTDESDFVVGQHWGRQSAEAYLLEQERARVDFPTTIHLVLRLAGKFRLGGAILVEDKANGPAVIQVLRRDVPGLIPVNPEGGKEARVHAVAPMIEAGNVYLPHPAFTPWVQEFIERAAAFPNAAHDDELDALSQALLRFKRHTVAWTPEAETPDEGAAWAGLMKRYGAGGEGAGRVSAGW